MNISLKGRLLSVRPTTNQQTGEVRHHLSILDVDGDDPEVIKLKAPKGLNVAELKEGAEYAMRLLIWRMGDRFGFYIPSADDLKQVKPA
jgi:hypothetical protein